MLSSSSVSSNQKRPVALLWKNAFLTAPSFLTKGGGGRFKWPVSSDVTEYWLRMEVTLTAELETVTINSIIKQGHCEGATQS